MFPLCCQGNTDARTCWALARRWHMTSAVAVAVAVADVRRMKLATVLAGTVARPSPQSPGVSKTTRCQASCHHSLAES